MNKLNTPQLERLILSFEKCGIKKYGRNIQIAEKTGYTPGMVAKVLSGHAALTSRFIVAACLQFGINRQWVETGQN